MTRAIQASFRSGEVGTKVQTLRVLKSMEHLARRQAKERLLKPSLTWVAPTSAAPTAVCRNGYGANTTSPKRVPATRRGSTPIREANTLRLKSQPNDWRRGSRTLASSATWCRSHSIEAGRRCRFAGRLSSDGRPGSKLQCADWRFVVMSPIPLTGPRCRSGRSRMSIRRGVDHNPSNAVLKRPREFLWRASQPKDPSTLR